MDQRGLPLVVLSLLMLIVGCLTSRRFSNNQVALFVFGDSLFDPGNNNYIKTEIRYRANFWPYGESYFNPPTGRFTNGRTVSDFIAEFARLPLVPGYLAKSFSNDDFVYGANFASGGAGTLNETNVGLVISLKTQLGYFFDLIKELRKNLGDANTKRLLSDAVYLFSSGSNDYDYVDMNTLEQYAGMVIENMTDVFKGIYKEGGRKFAMFNLPQIGCFPMIRALQPGNICKQERDIIAKEHNRQLSGKLEDLEKQLDGFMYSLLDYDTLVNNRRKNPSRYGFKVGDTACCGSGPFRGIYNCGRPNGTQDRFELCDNVNEYLFFDPAHPTEVACRQIAELFWAGDSSVTAPYNLKTLFGVRSDSDPFSSV